MRRERLHSKGSDLCKRSSFRPQSFPERNRAERPVHECQLCKQTVLAKDRRKIFFLCFVFANGTGKNDTAKHPACKNHRRCRSSGPGRKSSIFQSGIQKAHRIHALSIRRKRILTIHSKGPAEAGPFELFPLLTGSFFYFFNQADAFGNLLWPRMLFGQRFPVQYMMHPIPTVAASVFRQGAFLCQVFSMILRRKFKFYKIILQQKHAIDFSGHASSFKL